MVEFKNYAFDMSQLNTGDKATQAGAADRPFSELLWPPDDPNLKIEESRIRVELHKRLSAPFYPLAAFVIPFAFLGAPQTTRQNRNSAIAGAAIIFMAIEIAGFGTWGFVQRNESAWFLPYLMPLSAILPGLLVVAGLIDLRMPAFVQQLTSAVMARFERLQPA
jgi:lipopolysaccharide export system permease protein